MTIKGTLETFNLRELLQMLAFNQKVGTLALETDHGPRTVYVEDGRISLVTGDPLPSEGLLRVVRRRGLVAPDRLDRPVQIYRRSGRFLGDVLAEMGLLDQETRRAAYEEAVGELFFELALNEIHRFEFVESKAITPEGHEGEPIEPAIVVESLLLDLTRKLDQWSAYCEVIPGLGEVFEGTGLSVDLTPPRDEVIGLVRTVVGPADAARMEAVLKGATVERVEVADDGVVAHLVLEMPDAFVQARPPAPAAEAPLSPAELEAVERALERWDAFLVFVVKNLGLDIADPAIRAELFSQLHCRDLNGLTQRRLSDLCILYGVGTPCKIQGGDNRATELTADFLADLMSGPADPTMTQEGETHAGACEGASVRPGSEVNLDAIKR